SRVATLVAEDDQMQFSADPLLAALERLPGSLPVCPDRLRRKRLLDDVGRATGESQRREEPERDGASVGDGAVRPRLERVREGVPEIEQLAHPAVVRVPEAERRLVGGAAADELVVRQLPQRLAGEETGLDHLGQPLASVFLGQGREVVGVDDGADRPVDGADEVLALAQVARRLLAYSGVHMAALLTGI